MKFWFGSKSAAKPEKPAPAPAVTPAAPTPPSTPSAPVSAAPAATSPVSAPAEALPHPPPPRLGEGSLAEVDPEKPLAKATSLVRPQANQKVLYYQLMNGLYDAVLILDDNGHIVDCNNRVEPVLGYTRDEMWDMPVSTVVKGIGPQIFQQMRDALHDSHQVLINAKCTRKDGKSFQGEVGVCIMRLTRGENLVFTIRNVEKRIAALRDQLLRELKPATAATALAKPRMVLRKVTRPGDASAATAPEAKKPMMVRPIPVLKKVNN